MARRILSGAHVSAISRATRDDLARLFDLDSDDVALLMPAPHPQFTTEGLAADDPLQGLGLPARFLLATGGADPRKRNQALVHAWPLVLRRDGATGDDAARVPGATGDTTRRPGAPGGELLHLVIAGEPTRDEWEAALRAAIDESPSHAFIHRLPRLPFSALPALYRRAEALAFLSTHEGFGLPPLEAMASGTPVLVSPEGAVTEATGDAVLRIENVEENELANAVRDITQDAGLRADLRARGRERVALFSWEETARTMLTWIHANANG